MAFFDFDKACRVIFTATGFKRCGGGKYRQFCQVRIALNIVLNVGFLRHVNHLNRRVVLYQRQETVHIVGGLTDRLADKFTRRVVIGLQGINQFAVFRRQRFFRCCIVNRPRLRLSGGDLPFAAIVVEHQIDHPQMVAPHAWHHRRNAIERAFGNIRAFNIGKIFTREDRMGMAKHNRVNARHLA